MTKEEIIAKLADAQEALQYAGNVLKEITGASAESEDVSQAPTLEEVRSVLADLSRKGFTDKVRSLLVKHGANKLSEVDASHYASLLEEAKGICHG